MNNIKNIVVTGAANGIGKGICSRFLESNDYEVIGIDIEESTIDHPHYTHFIADVSKLDQLPDLENVNVLINNAGTQCTADNPLDPACLRDLEVNTLGTYYCTEKYAITPNISSVINICSASAHTGAEFPMYALSKGAILAYTKNVAHRIAKYGATCNSISPGGVVTRMNEHIMQSDKLTRSVLNETMLDKWASVEEIADWVAFIALVNTSMTAQDILIDNGEKDKQNFVW